GHGSAALVPGSAVNGDQHADAYLDAHGHADTQPDATAADGHADGHLAPANLGARRRLAPDLVG
ncbi:MAG: hypothetical protein ACK2U9_18005, partial [Anaerolineae bacterium]